MSDSIKVAIKVRPLIKREKEENLPIQWVTQGNSIAAIDAEMKKRGDGGLQFDHIFDMNSTNNDVFRTIVSPIVDAAVNGFNGTVFAYGQTSSGKTYTMMGTSEEAGIIPSAIEHMFDAIANTPGREFLLRVSYIEIYKERVNDLLNKNGIDLKVHEDPNGQVFVKCKEEVTNCPENVLSIMTKGDKNRRIGETNMNERSSRSHTIFRITIESREADAGSDGAIQVSQLNMVDLAGSERARQTGATGERLKEGCHINLSLSTLALVIKQLSEVQDPSKYINFRDSKLTRMLQASLGGNAMTAIICAVTPAALEETQCTLSFASRAKSVKNKPELNEVMSDGVLLKRYSKQIEKLHAELERMKKLNRSAEVEEMESKIQEKDRINECLEERIRLLQTRIVPGDNRNHTESFKCKAKRRRTWCGTGGYKLNTSSFHPCSGLSPIKEMSPLKPKKRNIINSTNMDSSFQIAYTDFELELLNSEVEREQEIDSDEDTLITCRKESRVKFEDDIIINKSPTNYENSDVIHEKINTFTQTLSQSPGTPKEQLRKKLSYLTKEYSQLQEYTTLEKQLHVEDHYRTQEKTLAKLSLLEKQLENVISDKNDFEHIASELRKKLTAAELRYVSAEDKLNAQTTELQRIPDLEKKLAQLSDQERRVQNIPNLQNQLSTLTMERDEYMHIATELQKKLNESEQCNMLLKDQLVKQNEEPLIRFSIGDKDNKLIELEVRVTNLTSEKDELQCKISHLQNKLTETESCSNSMKNKLNEQEIAFHQRLQNMEDQIINLTSEKNAFEHIVCEMQSKLREAEETNNTNEQQIETEKLKNQEKITYQKSEIEFNSELQQKLIEAKSIITLMKNRMNEHQQEHEFLQQLEKQIQDLITKKMETECNSSEIKNKLEETELMNISVKTNLNEQQSCMQDILDLEMQPNNNLTIEENEFERISNGMKEKLKELSISLENKPNTHNIDDLLQITTDIFTSENYKLKHPIPELQEELKETEVCNNTIKQELNAQGMEVQKIIIEQEKCIKNCSLEEDAVKNTIHEMQENSKKTELHSDLMNNSINKQLKLEKIQDLEKEIEYLTSKKNELKLSVQELQEKLGKTEDNISTQDKPDEENKLQLQKSEIKVAELTCKKNECEQVFIESHTQSVNTSSKKISTSSHNDVEEIDYLKNRIKDLQNIIQEIQEENARLKEQTSERSTMLDYVDNDCNLSDGGASKTMEDLSRASLGEDSAKLSADLILKTQELDEIKHDVQSLKGDIESLQKTIYLLTTENTELAHKLSIEKTYTEESTMHLQKKIDELYARNSQVTNEKLELENNLAMLNEQIETLRSNIPETNLNEEQMILKYKEQINVLTFKNADLLSNIADKMKELETLKESKSLLYEHDCTYKDKLTDLMKKYEDLTAENNELSTNVIDKIEENDDLRQECEMLKSKLELSLKNKENVDNNDADQLRTENTLLKTQLVELEFNIKACKEENSKVSNQLINTIEELDNAQKQNTYNDTLHLSTLWNNTLTANDTMNKSLTNDDLEAKILNQQQVINHLTHLNRKLSDLELSTCTQCTHLKELNEDRRMLRLEVKPLTRRLADLQRNFDREHAKTDALIMKAKRDINSSSYNSSYNSSFSEGINVTFVEETLQSVNSELQSLKADHDKLPNLHKEECDEIEELQNNSTTALMDDVTSTVKRSSDKTSSRLDNIIKAMNNLQIEFQELKTNNSSVRADLDKFTNEKESLSSEISRLKIANEDLLHTLSENEISHTTALEKASILENEVTDMTKKLQELTIKCKDIENAKLLLESKVESIEEEKIMKERTVSELRQSLSCLERELDLIKKQKEEFNDTNNFLEQEYEKNLASLKMMNEELTNCKVTISQEFADYTKETENKLFELNEKITKYISENDYLKQEMIKLRDVENKFEKMKNEHQSYQFKFQEDKTLAEDNKKLKDILNSASKNIINEIKSLKPKTDVQEFPHKSVEELFQIFLQTILTKEKEIMKTMQKNFDKERQKLEDEKQQIMDKEKRITLWTKELEREIEKLQGDLSEKENKSDELQKEVAHLKQLLEENDCDRNSLRDKINFLETDLSNLQIDLNKYSKIGTVNEETIITAQKREKQAQEMIKNKEAEFQMKLKSEKEAYNKVVEDLTCTIDSVKTKNIELISNIECLEINQKQLKNIIDLKTNEVMKNNQIIQTIRTDFEQLTQAYNDLNRELEEKKSRIAEITGLLRTKCDELMEYKANLETIVSENKFLKKQLNERKASVEKYKTEIETSRMTNEKEIEAIQDELNLKQLKNIELNKQIIESNNKNVALLEETNVLKNNYETLQCKCITLEKRARNSISKSSAEEQIEGLKDLNTSLRNNLDGASNRITEIQTAKTDLLKQLISLNGQYDTVYRENEELKESLSLYKSKYNNANTTDEKYDTMLREKNQLALELEATKVELNKRNREVETCTSKIMELTEKNTELDKELDELADVIRERNAEIGRLEDQFYSCRDVIDALEQKIKILEKSNQTLLSQSNRTEKLHDGKCNCEILKSKIRELQLEVVSKNGKVATLELQIRSGSVPYQMKCQELQENLSTYSNKNSELKAEIKRLQLSMLRTSAKECDACKQRLINRKNQMCQTINVPNEVVRFCGISSGIIADDIKITKLEKEKKIMKDLCRSRSKVIKDLEKQIENYKMLLHSKDPTVHDM